MRRTGCPLHDNIEQRHEEEVKKAADEAMAKVKAENPGVSDVRCPHYARVAWNTVTNANFT